MKRKYRVTVIRKQKWVIDVEAKDEDQAAEIAENESDYEPAHDDWAYETSVREL